MMRRYPAWAWNSCGYRSKIDYVASVMAIQDQLIDQQSEAPHILPEEIPKSASTSGWMRNGSESARYIRKNSK